jgi:hypothetical protein
MILETNNHDPAMRYESLARAVFDCDRYGGPDHCANASVFDGAFVPVPNERGKSIMHSIVDKIIQDGEYDEEEVNGLLDLKNRLYTATEQMQVIDVIDELIDFCNSNDY